MQLIQIVPALPPSVNGVGDYAALLADALRHHAGIESIFVVPSLSPAESTATRHSIARSSEQLNAVLNKLPLEAPVLLQYSGYGYHPQGFPLWLLAPLRERVRRGGRYICVFHELAASGPPWRKSFYFGPLQRWLYRKLFALASASITNSPPSLRALNALQGGPLHFAPSFSNVGEPLRMPTSERDLTTAIVFGQRPQRAAVYASEPVASEALQKLGIRRIVDIGPDRPGADSFCGISIERLGALPAEEISRQLSSSGAGLISYKPDYLCKSSIFAAYAAHGTVPLLLNPAGAASSFTGGLKAGEHYIDLSTTLPEHSFEQLSGAVYRWYQDHNIAAQATALASILRGTGNGKHPQMEE